jgi:hypothetical protein
VGQPLISYFGYRTDGVWNSTVDAAKANGLTSTLTGDLVEGGLRIVDVNGDKVILKIVLFLEIHIRFCRALLIILNIKV